MELSRSEFDNLSRFIYAEIGIRMPEVKRTMLAGRLQKRLRALKLHSFSAYCDFLFSPAGQEAELVHLFDVVTTNKTDFFREPAHFEFLLQEAIPTLAKGDKGRKLRLWSAGCSTGEEPYTLAMILREFQEPHPELQVDIVATDISTRVLEMARRAVYRQERIAPIPHGLKHKYLLRSRDRESALVRIGPEIRKMVRFGRLNFMDDSYGFREPFDVIFCRNVIIYFDKETQEKVIGKFCRHLPTGGYLFLGHSESLHGFRLPLRQVGPTVYRKTA